MRRSLFLVLFVAACGSAPQVMCPDAGTTLTYAGFGEAFMSKYCVACHGSSLQEKGVRLDSQSSVAQWEAQAVSEVSAGKMPPVDSLQPSAVERSQLAEWLSCGGR